jgi:hypothetical protein
MALIQPVVDGKIPKDTSTTSKSDTSNDLGYDQFLQLLCAEMQYQDPLEPTSNMLHSLLHFHRWKQHLVCRVQSRAAMQMHLLENMLLSRQHLRLEKQQQQRDLLIMYRKKTVSRRSV